MGKLHTVVFLIALVAVVSGLWVGKKKDFDTLLSDLVNEVEDEIVEDIAKPVKDAFKKLVSDELAERLTVKSRDASPERCTGGDSCCTPGNKCGWGEGDCDYDKDCKAGLTCGINNCAKGSTFDSTDDCCEISGLRCEGIDDGCCTEATPCKEHDGDCDNSLQCEGDLRCGTNNCAWGGDGDDCCEKRTKCTGEDSGCCVPGSECGEGEGDCDYDKDCKAGLVCGTNNCAKGSTFDATDDCCENVSFVQVPITGCWTKCGKKGGKCDVCGTEGWCCRKGNKDCPDHINAAGGDNGHTCVVPASTKK